MIYSANCKINIGLNVQSKREDGFHNLSTVMYPVKGLSDLVEVVYSDKFKFTSSGLEINCDIDKNLVVKAYKLIENEVGEQLAPLHIHLHKIVPFGAGLGGGSSDATFTLIAINELLNLNFSNEKLKDLASKLGSDTPFFVDNNPQLCSSRGEVTEPLEIDLSGLHMTIVKPPIFISTKEAFSGIKPYIDSFDLRNLSVAEIRYWRNYVKNDFENHIFEIYPQLKNVKDQLYASGALYASMSGSGSALYALSEDRICDKNFHNNNFFKSFLVK